MKKLLLLLAVFLWLPISQANEAEIKRGNAADASGDYKTSFPIWRSFAEQGHAEAQFNFGWMYDKGLGVEKNSVEALKWFRKASKQGHELAFKLYHKAATEGDVLVQYNLANMYYQGLGVSQNYVESFKLFRRAAVEGDAKSQFSLGIMYELGHGVPQDYVEAIKWYRKSAEQGYAGAQNNLGYMYYRGLAIRKNLDTARRWYSKAAKQGHALAQSNLGYQHYSDGGTEFSSFRKAIALGQAEAEYDIIALYPDEPNEDTRPQRALEAIQSGDYGTAFSIYHSLAEQGDASAQYNLGIMYYEGRGISRHHIYSYMWLSLAKTNGEARAQESLDFLRGQIASEDISKAQALSAKCWESNYADCPTIAQAKEEGLKAGKADFSKWRSLAAQGDASAQYNLGVMYYEGRGIPQSYIYSYMWLSLARTNGEERAQKVIEALGSFLSAADIVKTQSLASKCWESQYKDCSA